MEPLTESQNLLSQALQRFALKQVVHSGHRNVTSLGTTCIDGCIAIVFHGHITDLQRNSCIGVFFTKATPEPVFELSRRGAMA
jgi:hypothetical protein